MSVYFIAELGSNVFPYGRARMERLVQRAAWAGANAVKVQLFHADHFPVSERAEKVRYEFPRYEFDWYLRLARAHGLGAGASVFDTGAVRLCQEANADFVKLAAREQTNYALYDEIGLRFRGTTTYRSVTAPGLVLEKKWGIELGCIDDYPTSTERALGLVPTFERGLRKPWGWSSHTLGFEDCVEAVRLGATVIEKHLCLSDEDAEAGWSLRPEEFSEMVRACAS